LRAKFPEAEIRLVESSGGAFEVSLDGDLVFSKLRLGRHAHEGEVLRLIETRSGGAA